MSAQSPSSPISGRVANGGPPQPAFQQVRNVASFQSQSSASETPVEERRRGSFSFLRRSKTNESQQPQRVTSTTSKGNVLTRRRKSLSKREEERRKELERARLPPRLPSHPDLPTISAPFNHEDSAPPSPSYSRNPPRPAFYQRYNMAQPSSNPQGVPVPPVPEGVVVNQPQPFDPYARTESMTNRGRYSYASSAVSNINSPRRVRRRKDPTPFNILVIGTKNCGKTSFIEFLRNTLNRPIRYRPNTPSPPPQSAKTEAYGSFTSHYLETDLEGERIGVTLYDSAGLERHLVDLQLREMASFVESKFQETFNEEQKVLRATGVRDTHIHCVFILLDPSRLGLNIAAAKPKSFSDPKANYGKQRVIGGLDEDLDVDVIRTLQGKSTIIPVISKADTITTAHMTYLKRTVWDSLKKIKFDPLEAFNSNSDDDSDYDTANETSVRGSTEEQAVSGRARSGEKSGDIPSISKSLENQNLDPSKPPQHDDIRVSHLSETVDLPDLPMSIISPDMYEPGVIGRRFPWGFADPMNSDHCDFVRLKDSVFSEWRSDLREASREKWYEGWRTSRLRNRGSTPNRSRPLGIGQRTVSGAGAQPLMGRSPNGLAQQQQRSVSGPIGVAIGGDSPIEPNLVHGHAKGYTMH